MKSILDASFRYAPSFDTDLRRTFARVRDEQRTAAARRFGRPPQPGPGGSPAGVYLFRTPIVRLGHQ